jgi:hypothetical protein
LLFIFRVHPVRTATIKTPIPIVLFPLRINLMENAIKRVAASDSHSNLFKVSVGFGVLWFILQTLLHLFFVFFFPLFILPKD